MTLIVDFVLFGKSGQMAELDRALTEIFKCKDHLFIGFGFKSDLDKLK